MEMKTINDMEMYFEIVKDYRMRGRITYRLSEVLLVFVCGLLCGLRDYESITDMAEIRWEFFKKYIKNDRPPCPATLCNILRRINPEQLELCLHGIFRNVFGIIPPKCEKQICIDGKTIRGTNSIHIVTGMLADEYLSIGQKVVGEKTNEIPVVQELLDMLDIKGAVVSMDAMHCQKDTLEKVIENGGDYVVQLKGNQGNFYKDVYAMFDDKYMDETDKDGEYEKFQTIEKGHGRIEKRTCYVLKDVEYFTDYMADWKGLKKIFAVKRTVETKGKITEEISCYLSSKNTTAEKLLSYTRKHWQIESFHWILDVVMGEDNSSLRDKTAQDCMNRMSKFAVSVMKKYIECAKPKKKSISGNMRLCLLSNDYLEKVLDFFLHFFLLHFCYHD